MASLGLVYQPPADGWPTPRAWVGIREYAVLATGGPLLTPECASLAEVEEQVEALREELDAVLAEAGARFGTVGAAG